MARKEINTTQTEKVEVENVEKVVKVERKPIWIGTATTNLIVDSGSIEKGDKVKVLEDKDSDWLTDKGLVSKLFLLLEKP